jgi:hypothetical protein
MAQIVRLGPKDRVPDDVDRVTIQHAFTTTGSKWDLRWCYQTDPRGATFGQWAGELLNEAQAIAAAHHVAREKGISTIYILPQAPT